MYTLFLDTHGNEIIVSLYDGKDAVTKSQESVFGHAKYLVPMIDTIMKENNVSFKDIKNIVVVNGPGSFTGLRIGLSVGKTMAYSLGVSIYLISSLKAYLISDKEDDKKMAVIEDSKGYYIGIGDEEIYEDSLEKYSDYRIVSKELDVIKVIEYAVSKKPCDTHLVRANYVKKIEALK